MPGAIVCAGNWILDIVHTIETWPGKSELARILAETEGAGGGAANVAMNLAALGAEAIPVGLLGEDAHGQRVLAACRAAGLSTRRLKTTREAATAHTHVMNLPGDSRTFFYHPGANDLLSGADIPVEALAAEGAGMFYLGYVNLLGRLDRVEPSGETEAARLLARAQKAGMVTCADLVSAVAPEFGPRVKAVLPHLDYLFLNEIEAARATGLAIAGPEDRDGCLAAARALAAGMRGGTIILHTAALALWLGASGIAVWAEAEPVPREKILSPVGAGDAFCAGAISGIGRDWAPEACLRLAHRAAAASLASPTASGGLPKLADLMRE
jgi:sugar/nucleoside kinase (ribokinase family)